jgi:hypothetical protein
VASDDRQCQAITVRRTHGNVPFARCTYKAQRGGYCAQHQGQETRQAFLQALLRPDWQETQATLARKLLGAVEPAPVAYQTPDERKARPRATRAPKSAPDPTPPPADLQTHESPDSGLSGLLPSREEASDTLAALHAKWGLTHGS